MACFLINPSPLITTSIKLLIKMSPLTNIIQKKEIQPTTFLQLNQSNSLTILNNNLQHLHRQSPLHFQISHSYHTVYFLHLFFFFSNYNWWRGYKQCLSSNFFLSQLKPLSLFQKLHNIFLSLHSLFLIIIFIDCVPKLRLHVIIFSHYTPAPFNPHPIGI